MGKLIISRKYGEEFYVIPQNAKTSKDVIIISVLDGVLVNGRPQIKLGIDADERYKILRKELVERVGGLEAYLARK